LYTSGANIAISMQRTGGSTVSKSATWTSSYTISGFIS
jgi:hypothetical protein